MITRLDMEEAERALRHLDADGPLLRLAELLSPASRIEPELLRAMRLELVPDADVSTEQALWFSELIRSRDDTAISISVAVACVLRQRLRRLRQRQINLVKAARELMTKVHAELSPVLVVEETLAWAEVFDEEEAIRTEADRLLEALNAKRDGLDHWLARAWEGLPRAFKDSPSGRNLAQIAALRGATIETGDAKELRAERVAHLLPRTPILLSRKGSKLRVGVSRPEATHAVQLPDTVPLVVDVHFEREGKRLSERLEVRPDTPALEVGDGPLTLRCVDGTEYNLEPRSTRATEHPSAGTALFSVELLPARHGSCLLLRYGGSDTPSHVVIDCGPTPSVAHDLRRRLETSSGPPLIDLLVVTHIDSDRIRGALSLLSDKDVEIRDVWFNGSHHMPSEEFL